MLENSYRTTPEENLMIRREHAKAEKELRRVIGKKRRRQFLKEKLRRLEARHLGESKIANR